MDNLVEEDSARIQQVGVCFCKPARSTIQSNQQPPQRPGASQINPIANFVCIVAVQLRTAAKQALLRHKFLEARQYLDEAISLHPDSYKVCNEGIGYLPTKA